MNWKEWQQYYKQLWKQRYKLADKVPANYRNPMKEAARDWFLKPWGMLTKAEKDLARANYKQLEQR